MRAKGKIQKDTEDLLENLIIDLHTSQLGMKWERRLLSLPSGNLRNGYYQIYWVKLICNKHIHFKCVVVTFDKSIESSHHQSRNRILPLLPKTSVCSFLLRISISNLNQLLCLLNIVIVMFVFWSSVSVESYGISIMSGLFHFSMIFEIHPCFCV